MSMLANAKSNQTELRGKAIVNENDLPERNGNMKEEERTEMGIWAVIERE